MKTSAYFVYVVECRDGSFYTGWTTNVQARVDMHNSGKGSKYCRSRLPVKLRWFRSVLTKSEAMRWEAAIKRLPRWRKEGVIRGGHVLTDIL